MLQTFFSEKTLLIATNLLAIQFVPIGKSDSKSSGMALQLAKKYSHQIKRESLIDFVQSVVLFVPLSNL